ncbi:MAG TPA: hypothetical protein VF032_15945 [Thermoleophilaceae bacterium]
MLIKQIALLVGAFVIATLLALAFGAKNLGTALTFGQMAFAATLLAVMMLARRPRARDPEE